MTSPRWTALGAPLPPVGRAMLLDDGRGGLLLFLDADTGPAILRWTGSGFSPVVSSPFGEDEHVETCFGCFDPRADEMIFLGLRRDGLLVASETRGLMEKIDLKGIQSWNGRSFAAFHPRREEIWLVLPGNRMQTMALKGGALTPIAEGPRLISIAWNPHTERLLGVTVSSEVHEFDGSKWSLAGRSRHDGQLAFYPRLGAVVQLVSDGRDGLHLVAWRGKSFSPIDPEMRLPTFRSGFALGVDATRDQVVMFGGQDFDKGLSFTNESFVSTKGGPFESTMSPAYLPVGRYNTACALEDGALVVINHSAVTASHFEGDRWTSRRLKEGDNDDYAPNLDDRGLNFTASREGVWALDSEGALLFAPWGKLLSRKAPPEGGPGSRYSGRVAMAWDEPRRRVVLFGGESRNDTWVFEGKKWREILGGPRPPSGSGALCATPEGILLLVQGELWRLDGDAWRWLAKADAWGARTLLHDTKRRRLWSIAGGKVATLDDGRFHAVADLPPGVRVPPSSYNMSDTIGIDNNGDQLVAVSEAGVFTLTLDTCGVGPGAIPTTPLAAVERRPSPEMIRKAASFTRKKTTAAPPPGLKIPKAYTILAVLPADGKALSLPSASGIAVAFNANASGDGWDLGGKATRVIFLPPGAPPQGLVLDEEKGGLVPFSLSPFDELDPDHEDELDTLPGNARQRSFGSKIGGFPRFIQDSVKGQCPKCKSPLRFAAQLAGDTCTFGDVGSLFVFVCPKECWAGAAVQCH